MLQRRSVLDTNCLERLYLYALFQITYLTNIGRAYGEPFDSGNANWARVEGTANSRNEHRPRAWLSDL